MTCGSRFGLFRPTVALGKPGDEQILCGFRAAHPKGLQFAEDLLLVDPSRLLDPGRDPRRVRNEPIDTLVARDELWNERSASER